MALNFNISPYYDDFDPSKNFHRILFKPGYAVQARELTQSQTILQDQISKFADHIFSQNTPVSGGKVTTNLDCYYLKLNNQYNGTDVVASAFLNKIITDSTGTIVAKVIATAEATGTDAEAGDPPTLIVTYFSGVRFSDAMSLVPTDGTNIGGTTIGATNGTTCTGKSSTVSISDGVFYVVNGYSTSSTQNPDGTYSKYSVGNFVSVLPQTVILNKYSATPSYRVGLQITESIEDSIGDTSLLDPAVGASNYQAPGADRYKIDLILSTLPLTLGNDDQFIELLRIENGDVVKQINGTAYSELDDYFAKRTFETNGDYIVNNFKLTPSANTLDSSKYILSIGPGKAYVQGYRLENQSILRLNGNRARTTANINNNTNFIDYGSYLLVDNMRGNTSTFFEATTGNAVDFHTVGKDFVNVANTITYNSTVAASGYIRNIVYQQTANDANANAYVYKAYVFDIANKVLTGTAASGTASSIGFADTNGRFSAAANAYYDVTITIDSGTSAGDTRRIISYNGTTKTANVDVPFTVSPDITSNFSLRFSTYDVESVIQPASGTPYTIQASAAVADVGKIGSTTTGYTQLFNASSPELLFPLGNQYVDSVTDSSYTTSEEFRNQAFGTYAGTGSRRYLQLDPAVTGTFDFIRTGTTESTDAIKQNFVVVVTDRKTNTTIQNGDILPFTIAGRSIAVDSDKNGVTFTATDLNPFTATIYIKLSVTNANDTNNVLKTKTAITGNTTAVSFAGPDGIVSGSYIDLTKAQVYVEPGSVVSYGNKQSLYVSDVTKITKILDCGYATPSTTMLNDPAYDITENYTFNDGQTDNYYGHSYITLKPGASKPTSLLVIFDYYQHAGGDGYFSAQSYAAGGFTTRPTYKARSGVTYDLKDCLDFRPAVKNAQGSFIFTYKITPTTTNNSGYFLPVDLTGFTSDYSYFLGRKDILVLGKDKNFQIIEGTPAINPVFPSVPDGSMLIANITLDPYTAYIPGEVTGKESNLSVAPIIHKRWAMSDISDVETRLNRLEYYTALNLVEQKATSLQIPDALGLNRFKYGILVDDFSTFGVGDTFNDDFSASINTIDQSMSAAVLVNNYPLQNLQLLDATNSGKLSAATITSLGYFPIQNGKSSTFTLPYTETSMVVQPLSSAISTSVNPSTVARSTGVVSLTPPMDNWIDNSQQPALLFIDPNIKSFKATSTTNLLAGDPTLAIGNWQNIPGTQKTTTKSTTVDRTTTTTTSTTVSKQNSTTYGYWSETYNQSGNYLTNINILPYIRAQQIQFNATGMLFNTNVNAFFDSKRVTRLIRKPNIIELINVSGAFTPGDIVGYTSGSNFIKTASIIDVHNYTNSANVRLYVIGDGLSTSYTPSVLRNAFYNTSGVYQNSTASGTIKSATHYSGQLNYANSSTSVVNVSVLAATTDIYTGLEFNIVGGSTTGISAIPIGKNAVITAYDTATKQVTLDKTVAFQSGDVYSIGPLQTNEVGSISGVFYLPGGYFNTGDRVFRLDNRLVTQTENEFIYTLGTETTSAEGKFVASGLATQSQEINYSASITTAKNTVTRTQTQDNYVINQKVSSTYNPPPGGGGCCVISTAFNDMGMWSSNQKNELIEWCEKYLHNKTMGECFRRGYQVLGSKIVVPTLRSDKTLAKKYFKWAFDNGTNMVRGKKFSWLSVPNTVLWIAGFMIVGAVVSKEYATKSWKKLYE